MAANAPVDWRLPAALLALSAIPVAAGGIRLVQIGMGAAITPDNARFVAMPLAVVLHIMCATLFCVLGAFQFDAALRRRHPRLHRHAGRVVAPCGVVAALSGLWMTVATPIPAALQGDLLQGARMVVGLAMALSLAVAVGAVRQGRIARHRAWMVRAYALGQGAGTQVLIMLPVAWLAGPPTGTWRDVLMASAWGVNVLLAEWIIRRASAGWPHRPQQPD